MGKKKNHETNTGFLRVQIGFLIIVFSQYLISYCSGQNYEVADIDCAIGTGGKELLTAKLRRPDGFRGTPIFADDRGSLSSIQKEPPSPLGLQLPPLVNLNVPQDILDDGTCQIIPDPGDSSGRVFKLRITDFTQCGVMKRNGFIHVRIWFPQLPGVVMLSDQEVIIMCKPPAATIVQSKTAGFAGSIPSGARISGIVEESPGRLEYEVALYRETSQTPSSPSLGRSTSGGGAYITGMDSHELPVDQAVPIGTRLQLRAKINADSAWKHAKLMEVSVSPDPKNPGAEGSVSLVRDGCRNPDLVSIIPKQPYRYKDRTNEVVLDFEAFLLSNMHDRSTLWLHTQIKACMEPQDCHPAFCLDVFDPSGYGKRKRRRRRRSVEISSIISSINNSTGVEYSSPLSTHWTAYADEIIIDNEPTRGGGINNETSIPIANLLDAKINETSSNTINVHKEDIGDTVKKYMKKDSSSTGGGESTKFGENIGFSVIMPADYYRSSSPSGGDSSSSSSSISIFSSTYECRVWASATLGSLLITGLALMMACLMGVRMRRYKGGKGVGGMGMGVVESLISANNLIPPRRPPKQGPCSATSISPQKYARDPSIYRS